jgi:hypothetical protein
MIDELQVLSREQVVQMILKLPAEQQAEAAAYALALYGEAPQTERFKPYRFAPARYVKEFLGWEPWSGDREHPGQKEIYDAYVLALRQQLERRDFEKGLIAEEDLQYWTPGETIKYVIHVQAGHTVGKTKGVSGLVSHFFDCFPPAIIYTFAPTWQQIKYLLWKEIKTDRAGKDLPGRVLESCEIKYQPNHFALGKATDNSGGTGTEKAQGQHGEYLMFVLDEAEGVADFVFDAVDSMASGGIVIVLMVANPKTRTSRFHKTKALSNVASFRMSCVYHPNVRENREIVPGAVKRQYVETMLEKHCEIVPKHDEDEHTFELPFDIQVGKNFYPQGTIFLPDAEFLFRVLGIAPANLADNTLVTPGRYEAATKRTPSFLLQMQNGWARLGVDVARFGRDYGTLYARHAGSARRVRQFYKLDTNEYAGAIIDEAKRLAALGVKSLHVRVDGGGGFGGGVVDRIKDDAVLKGLFTDFQVFEIHFNSTAPDKAAYADWITNAYAEAAETLKGLALEKPPEALEADLCERTYKWVNLSGVAVKRLESKDDFRKRLMRSPDDGDGCVLAIAPDHLFVTNGVEVETFLLR